jgi:hypothetical protein
MRVCYFIQNHLPPAQVCRLVGTLRRARPDAFVLVCHDAFAGHCPAAALRRALEAPVLETREPARRGYFSLLAPYFDAVEWLAAHGVAYDWLAYLSAQDYPTRPLASFEAKLAASGCDGYLRFWNAFDAVNPWGRRHQGRRRYAYQYADAPRWTEPALRLLRAANGLQSLLHVHLVYGPRIGLHAKRTPFGPGLACYAGTQWTTLRRAAAEYVTAEVRADGPLVRWFRRTVCPDEAVVQTLLSTSNRFRLVDDDLRYADVAGSRNGRPRTLTAEDLPRITAGPYYFARKFDLEHDARVLDLLDAAIG